jgi:hypothetical protein
MPKRLLGVAAVASITAALVLPSAASAGNKAGELTYQQTFPVASKLCTDVAAGKKKHLIPVTTQVLAACETLNTNFTTAQTAVVAARTTLKADIAADRALIKAACPPATKLLRPACTSARHTEQAAISVLRAELLAAVHGYYKTIEADRRAFWATIKALRPARHIAADKPITQGNK